MDVKDWTTGTALPGSALVSLVEDATKKLTRRSDLSWLCEDVTLADVTLNLRVRGGEAAEAAAAGQREEQEAEEPPQAQASGGAGKRRAEVMAPQGAAAAKKAKGDGASGGPTILPPAETIKAHAVVLVKESGYFKGALMGRFQEGVAKTVDLDFEDQEGEEDNGSDWAVAQ